MGAGGLKIEAPDGGIRCARWGRRSCPAARAHTFLAINRNKKSLVLDLGKPAGRDVFLDLVAQADVVWRTFRPGVMARLGLDYQALASVNPRW